MSVPRPLEEWRDIPGFEGFYRISNYGRVRGHSGQIMICRVDHNGYPVIHLRLRGSSWMKKVHQLVLLAFKGPMPDGMQVDHKNRDRTDNFVGNLQYLTNLENVRKAWRQGRKPLVGSECGSSKLSATDIRKIRNLKGRHSQRIIGRMFGITQSQVSNIHTGKRWGHLDG